MNEALAKQITAASPLASGIERVEFLDKGCSDDKKFVLWEKGEPRYVLRLSEANQYERRETELDIMSRLRRREVLCPEPHGSGITQDGQVCYTIVSYIVGEDATDALPLLDENKQYELGVLAGRQLRTIHEIHHPDPDFDWPARRRAKYRSRVEEARQFNLTFHRQADIESYIEKSLGLLDMAPIRFQHDDFHPGNLILNEGKFAGVIDFNRFDWGDPIEDFYKVPWFTTETSVPFAIGQIEGYLSRGPIEDFWKRYNFLVALNLHSSIVYAYKGGWQNGVMHWKSEMVRIIEAHDFETSGPPRWFDSE